MDTFTTTVGEKPQQRQFTQIDLISCIFRFLADHGHPDSNHRQVNAVIAAANSIIAEIDKPTVLATPGMGLTAWLRSDDTGLSSKYLAKQLWQAHSTFEVPIPCSGIAYPRDPSDFGRCVRMLESQGILRDYFAVMLHPEHGPVWNALAAEWETLEALYREELPSGDAPKLYARMREIIATAEAKKE